MAINKPIELASGKCCGMCGKNKNFRPLKWLIWFHQPQNPKKIGAIFVFKLSFVSNSNYACNHIWFHSSRSMQSYLVPFEMDFSIISSPTGYYHISRSTHSLIWALQIVYFSTLGLLWKSYLTCAYAEKIFECDKVF